MARRDYNAEEVLGMLSDVFDEDTDDGKESDLFDTDLEISDNSDDEDDSDIEIGDDVDLTGVYTNGWRAWLPSDDDLPHYSFTPHSVGATLLTAPQTELEFFQSFYKNKLLMQLVTATNAYALIRLGGKNVINNSIWHRWKPVTLSELKAYLGVLLKMALVEKLEVKDYFS